MKRFNVFGLILALGAVVVTAAVFSVPALAGNGVRDPEPHHQPHPRGSHSWQDWLQLFFLERQRCHPALRADVLPGGAHSERVHNQVLKGTVANDRGEWRGHLLGLQRWPDPEWSDLLGLQQRQPVDRLDDDDRRIRALHPDLPLPQGVAEPGTEQGGQPLPSLRTSLDYHEKAPAKPGLSAWQGRVGRAQKEQLLEFVDREIDRRLPPSSSSSDFARPCNGEPAAKSQAHRYGIESGLQVRRGLVHACMGPHATKGV